MYKAYCIKQYVYNVFWGLQSRNAIYLTTSAQRRYMGAKLYWAKEITADENSDPQEKVKRTRNDKKARITKALRSFLL